MPYRGQCLVHRSQVLLAHGDWIGATAEAHLAAERLTEPPHPALGTARYQQGELHRLRGEFAEADAAYREAGTLGRDPSPGIALLRLAEARVDDAAIAIRRMLAEGGDPRVRPAVLAAAVEIFLAADDVVEARLAHDELATIADAAGVPALRTMADGALGALLLAGGDAGAAVAALRRAIAGWQALGMPYETARARVTLADARVGRSATTTAPSSSGKRRARRSSGWVRRPTSNASPALDGARHRTDRRPDRPRGGGAPPRRHRAHEPRDRRDPRHQRAHRRPPPAEHLPQARLVVAGSGDGVRLRAPPHRLMVRTDHAGRGAVNGRSGRCGHAPAAPYVRPMPTTTSTPTVEQLATEFNRCFETFEAPDGLFADGAFFDLYPPFWRFQLQGAEAVGDQLRAISEGVPPVVRTLRVVPTATGFVTEHEEVHADGDRPAA